MLNVFRMDWIATQWRGYFGFFIAFMMIVQGTWKQALSATLMVSFLIIIITWYAEETHNGRSLSCSLPINRKTFIRGRFLSAWLFIGYSQLIFIVVIFLKYAISPDLFQPLLEIFSIQKLLIFLTLTTIILSVLTLLYARFNGKIVLYSVLIGLFLILVPLISTSILNDQIGVDYKFEAHYKQFGMICKDTLRATLRYDNPTVLNYLVTIVSLFAVNLGTVWIAEKLFQKNNIHNN